MSYSDYETSYPKVFPCKILPVSENCFKGPLISVKSGRIDFVNTCTYILLTKVNFGRAQSVLMGCEPLFLFSPNSNPNSNQRGKSPYDFVTSCLRGFLTTHLIPSRGD